MTQTLLASFKTRIESEPYRLFFPAGIAWSIAGVSLWPLFYAGKLPWYPGLAHARVMIEVFGGAFVAGFLGTAGPRMVSAPRLTLPEICALLVLNTASGFFHLRLMIKEGDTCFAAMLALLLGSLAARVLSCRRENPPPQMVLVLTGLVCGIAGAIFWMSPDWMAEPYNHRMAALLLYQGLLLTPVLGVGSFIFPRILGGQFGIPDSARQAGTKLIRAGATAVLIIVSFLVEAYSNMAAGGLLRSMVVASYFIAEAGLKPQNPGVHGSLATGLYWAAALCVAGIATASVSNDRRVTWEHLLFIGGFGLLMLVVASRVIFGHSGQLALFGRRSWMARILVFLALLTAATRSSADFWPAIMASHYKYAAWTWICAASLWLFWHGKRFLRSGE
jgi:uncharacterized protein involved in response to NO